MRRQKDDRSPDPTRPSMTPMQGKNQTPENNSQPIPEDGELFASEPCEQLTEQEIFVGDDDLYQSLERFEQPENSATPGARKYLRFAMPLARMSLTQKVLILAIAVVGGLLLYTVSEPGAGPAKPPEPQLPGLQEFPGLDAVSVVSAEAHQPEAEIEPATPVSLKTADELFRHAEYARAYAAYDRLRQLVPPDERNYRALLHLKMTLCRIKAGKLDNAERLLDEAARSKPNIVRLVANYYKILLAMQKNQYLKARANAYRAVALVSTIETDAKLSASIRTNCYFMIAQALTRYTLSLCDLDGYLPGSPGDAFTEIDPFAGLRGKQLDALLQAGSGCFDEALLGPEIRKIDHKEGPARWYVVCREAPIDELLARFATNASLDLSWAPLSETDEPGKLEILRNRPVTMYLPAATAAQVVAVAAGQVGLLASITPQGLVTIHDPERYSSLSEHTTLVAAETVSLWQKFVLAFENDRRTSNAHFALGLLHMLENRLPEAIAEFKLVSNRFSWSPLAPYALLHSSRIKASPSVRDYVGAHNDLKNLVEQYPDAEIANHAHLQLAEYTAKAGMITEAARLYAKVYNLSFSPESRRTAALGAGKCYYQTNDYHSATRWLIRYINLAETQKNHEVCSACFLLGQAYLALGQPRQASEALELALAGPLPKNLYAQALRAITDAYALQEKLVRALEVLEDVDTWQLSQAESVEILLIKSRILRRMGLVDNAMTLLQGKADYLTDVQLKARITFELANCLVDKGQLQQAYEKLTEIIVAVQPGPLAHSIALKLAQLCSRLGRNQQAISVCSQLLKSTATAQIKQEAATLLARIYSRQKHYDKAVLALLDDPKPK